MSTQHGQSDVPATRPEGWRCLCEGDHDPGCAWGTYESGGSLLEKRLTWERENPRPEPLRRAERAIVRALRDAGFGSQSQVTRDDGFDIAVDDIIVRVEVNGDA